VLRIAVVISGKRVLPYDQGAGDAEAPRRRHDHGKPALPFSGAGIVVGRRGYRELRADRKLHAGLLQQEGKEVEDVKVAHSPVTVPPSPSGTVAIGSV
jgi:hypothetical protein